MSASTEHPTPLSNSSLASLPPGVPGPTYDRGRVSVGIVTSGSVGSTGLEQALIVATGDGDVLVSAVILRKQAPDLPITALVNITASRGCYPGGRGGPWLCRILVRSGL